MQHDDFYKCWDVFLGETFCFLGKENLPENIFSQPMMGSILFNWADIRPVCVCACGYSHLRMHTWAQSQSKAEEVVTRDSVENGKLWTPSRYAKLKYVIDSFWLKQNQNKMQWMEWFNTWQGSYNHTLCKGIENCNCQLRIGPLDFFFFNFGVSHWHFPFFKKINLRMYDF